MDNMEKITSLINKALDEKLKLVLPKLKDECVQIFYEKFNERLNHSLVDLCTEEFKETISEKIQEDLICSVKAASVALAKSETTKEVQPKKAKAPAAKKSLEEIFDAIEGDLLIDLYNKKQAKYNVNLDKGFRESGLNLVTKKDFVLKEQSIVSMMTLTKYGDGKKLLFTIGRSLEKNNEIIQKFVDTHSLRISEVVGSYPNWNESSILYDCDGENENVQDKSIVSEKNFEYLDIP